MGLGIKLDGLLASAVCGPFMNAFFGVFRNSMLRVSLAVIVCGRVLLRWCFPNCICREEFAVIVLSVFMVGASIVISSTFAMVKNLIFLLELCH